MNRYKEHQQVVIVWDQSREYKRSKRLVAEALYSAENSNEQLDDQLLGLARKLSRQRKVVPEVFNESFLREIIGIIDDYRFDPTAYKDTLN